VTRAAQRGLPDVPAVFLYPGTMYCAPQPSVITTVLGSCVAVCLTDRRRGISGLNHYLLPDGAKGKPSLRHGETAIPLLLDEMLRLGCRSGDIEAKVFGGAAVLSVNKPEDAVGAKNIAVALACLRTLDIEIVARRTGGKSGMLARLFTATGEVLVRRVSPASGWPDATLLSPPDRRRPA
jgi:chemotaxis protein CheD